jgi:2C-methyl-D-erythritol 2,4-cyclodiphosphate synthase
VGVGVAAAAGAAAVDKKKSFSTKAPDFVSKASAELMAVNEELLAANNELSAANYALSVEKCDLTERMEAMMRLLIKHMGKSEKEINEEVDDLMCQLEAEAMHDAALMAEAMHEAYD